MDASAAESGGRFITHISKKNNNFTGYFKMLWSLENGLHHHHNVAFVLA